MWSSLLQSRTAQNCDDKKGFCKCRARALAEPAAATEQQILLACACDSVAAKRTCDGKAPRQNVQERNVAASPRMTVLTWAQQRKWSRKLKVRVIKTPDTKIPLQQFSEKTGTVVLWTLLILVDWRRSADTPQRKGAGGTAAQNYQNPPRCRTLMRWPLLLHRVKWNNFNSDPRCPRQSLELVVR